MTKKALKLAVIAQAQLKARKARDGNGVRAATEEALELAVIGMLLICTMIGVTSAGEGLPISSAEDSSRSRRIGTNMSMS